MATRDSYPFAISSEHRSSLGVDLRPGRAVVATLLQRPRAQFTPEERTVLSSGKVRYQWGLGIGLNECNLLYVMHRAVDEDFATAQLAIQIKTNVGQSTHAECGGGGYSPTIAAYTGPDLGILVVARSDDGKTLFVRGYDISGATLLSDSYSTEVPAHWERHCHISLRGDNCLAAGVITV